jgi:hypothetical protein
MTADVSATHSPRLPIPEVLLFSASALTQFVIQAFLAYGFAAHVWGLAQPLPWCAPVALDLFAVTMMAFTFRLRSARLRRRVYAWFWLAVAIAAQVGASEGYADHLGWNWWGRIASLFPAVFLAASLHSLIIAAREMDAVPPAARRVRLPRRPLRRVWSWLRRTPPPAAPPAETPPAAGEVDQAADEALAAADRAFAAAAGTGTGWPGSATPARVTTHRPRRSRRAAGRGEDRRADAVSRVIDAGETAVDVAKSMGEKPRNVQNWVKAERERRAAGGPVTSRSVPAPAADVPAWEAEFQTVATGPSDAPAT